MVAIAGATIAELIIVVAIVVVLAVLARSSVRMVRPTHRGLVERLGKYNRYAGPGIHGVLPIIEHMYQVDIREMLVEAQPQEIITNDNLNARVDAQVYLKVKADEENVKASLYNVTNYQNQVVNLARTTLRNIIGTLSLKSANSERARSTKSCARRSRPRPRAGASRSCAPSSRRSTLPTTCRRP